MPVSQQQDPDDPKASLEQVLDEHRALDRQVQSFACKLYLTPEQQLELNELKKRKLAKKDLITSLQARLP